MITLADLISGKTPDAYFDQLIQALKGIGFVEQQGVGTGSAESSGLALKSYTVKLTIVTAGGIGTAEYQYTLTDDNGNVVETSAVDTMPGDGIVTIDDTIVTGLTLTFSDGPANSGDSFAVGDTYTVAIANPTFPVTAWQDGGVARTLVHMDAQALSDLRSLAANIAKGGLLTLATGPWLDLLAANMYGLTRSPAVIASGDIQLTVASGSGPYTVAAGDIWVSDNTGRRFVNIEGGTLSSAAPVLLAFQGEAAGSAYNVANGTITVLVTSYPGVTVTNPSPGGGASWATTAGVDTETDAALVKRCEQRWPGLGGGATAAVYEFWAVSATDQVTRVRVEVSTTVAGQIDIRIAGPAGAVAGGVVTAVQDYIDERAPLTSVPSVASATSTATQVTATIKVKAASLTQAQADATEHLDDYFNNLPIGGDYISGLTPPTTGIISREKIIAALANCTGVVDVSMSLPAADINLTIDDVPTYTPTLTWVSV